MILINRPCTCSKLFWAGATILPNYTPSSPSKSIKSLKSLDRFHALFNFERQFSELKFCSVFQILMEISQWTRPGCQQTQLAHLHSTGNMKLRIRDGSCRPGPVVGSKTYDLRRCSKARRRDGPSSKNVNRDTLY